jgi:alanyl-tRNA synthetase
MFEEEYQLDFFKGRGYTRHTCAACGKPFWSFGDEDNCGETPCSEYTFIGNPPTKKRFELGEMRESILSFFEKNGHERISRYPIIARWRDDVFFTQASIYDFQPWVINGVSEPPANPLIVSQTCARFNDIDNVGKTGRHYTMFEMIGHHAFNYPDKFVYWKDEALGYCHDYMLNELGLKEEIITYKEKPWMGGGNAGPSVEVIVQGLELATIVFMNLKRDNSGSIDLEGEKYAPMQLRVVDPGWGLERFAWLSQGTASAYEATFGDILENLKKKIEVPETRILETYSKLSGAMNFETPTDLVRLRKVAAEKVGMPEEELFRILAPLESVYLICDHSRALVFLLNDGVVPSNVKEGYFSRLLVRRILKALSALGMETKISELLESQISQLKEDFPEFEENREGIIRLANVEEERYGETLRKGKGLVNRMETEMTSKGLDGWNEEQLVQLYDSHGLTPEVVKEFTELKLEIPQDFYMKVAERHEDITREEERTELPPELKDMRETEILYYEEDVLEFEAKVLGISDDLVVLDRSYFFPEGGGELGDMGTIGKNQVLDVQNMENIVVHKVNKPVDLKVGDKVKCIIDEKRRRALTAHHTATHIINGAARKLLGNHVWQAGAHKSPDSARLDITHYKGLTEDDLREIERLANEVVAKNLEIEKSFMDRAKAEKLYGFRLYQGGCVPGKELRVVNIVGWDVEACGGTHTDSTGEVGFIKMTGAKRIQDGVVRLEYVAGDAAVKYVSELEDKLRKTERKLNELKLESSKPSDADMVLADIVLERADTTGQARIVAEVLRLGSKELLKVAKEITSRGNAVVIIGSDKDGARLIVARSDEENVKSLDCAGILKEVMPIIEGSGGGKPDYAQGGGSKPQGLGDAVNEAKKLVLKALGQ